MSLLSTFIRSPPKVNFISGTSRVGTVGGGMGLPKSRAASSQAPCARRTSRKASSGVSPKAEQYFKSGMSAMYPPSSALKNTFMR